MDTIDKYLPIGLVIISAILLCWGVLGLLEYVIPATAFGLQNKNFPAGLQFLHFFAICLTGAIFLYGYFTRWRHTPSATVTMYAVLATLCFIETIDFAAFGGGTSGLALMTLEFAVYAGLSAYLLRSPVMQNRFG